MSYRSSVQYSGGDADSPDYVYYNADIINNTTDDQAAGRAISDPEIRFNETRDTAIVKDASQYYFSIVRFSMDGANRDLPLFIPQVQESTGQTNPNLTQYGMAFSLEGIWYSVAPAIPGTTPITATPPIRFVQYQSETQNTQLAPVPRALQNARFLGGFLNTTQYKLGDIVGTTDTAEKLDFFVKYNSFLPPFYTPKVPNEWLGSQSYQAGASVLYKGVIYYTIVAVPGLSPPPGSPLSVWLLGPPLGSTGFLPSPSSPYWTVAESNIGSTQDISSRYYWTYTYEAWLDNVNRTIYDPADGAKNANLAFNCCWGDLYKQIYVLLSSATPSRGGEFLTVYPTLSDFAGYTNSSGFAGYVAYPPPTVQFDPNTNRFKILACSQSFGDQTGATYPSATSGFSSSASTRTFFNSNMFGLFSNFSNIYWNTTLPTLPCPFPGFSAPLGYVNEILTPNHLYQNLLTLTAPPAPTSWAATNVKWWIIEQDWNSNDALWSPISSIVFTSTLLPVKTESTGVPVVLGQGNLGISSATVQSAFQPIITDISLDTSTAGSQSFRRFTLYVPAAEYRLSDFTASKQEIRNIDVQVFWKSRLDNKLYPIYMFNLSSVSLKMMFKHKRVM